MTATATIRVRESGEVRVRARGADRMTLARKTPSQILIHVRGR